MPKRILSPARKIWFEAHKDERRIYMKKYRETNKEALEAKDKVRRSSPNGRRQHKNVLLKNMYGIGIEYYEAMLELQSNRCAICRIHEDELRVALCVDHNHITNKIRGLLCDTCNRGIGMLRDSPEICKAAASYLERYTN